MPERKSPTRTRTEDSADILSKATKKLTKIVDENNGLIYIEKGVTKNLGDYNSCRVTIGMVVPINATEDDFREAKRQIRKTIEVVDKVLEDEVNAVLDELEEEEEKPRRR